MSLHEPEIPVQNQDYLLPLPREWPRKETEVCNKALNFCDLKFTWEKEGVQACYHSHLLINSETLVFLLYIPFVKLTLLMNFISASSWFSLIPLLSVFCMAYQVVF